MAGGAGIVAYAITVEDATRGLFVAWRLLLRDERAAGLIDDSYQGVVKSFWSAILALPAFGLILYLQTGIPSDQLANFGVLAAEAGLANALGGSLVAYAVTWLAWPLVMDRIAPALGCDAHYFRYLAAYNWMSAFWWLIMLGYTVLRFTNVVTLEVASAFGLGVLTIMWAYHWFVIRTTLKVSGGVAGALVAVDFMLMSVIDQTGQVVSLQ